MGREVRRVPPDWQHPKDEYGRYKPMYDESFDEAVARWKEGYDQWENGLVFNWALKEWEPRTQDAHDCEFWEWEGNPPDREYYRPKWTDGERTHYMMYQNTSEGTPISPAFATPEELARWLADTGASSFGKMTATYEQWLSVCRGGWAPSAAIVDNRGVISGIEAISIKEQ